MRSPTPTPWRRSTRDRRPLALVVALCACWAAGCGAEPPAAPTAPTAPAPRAVADRPRVDFELVTLDDTPLGTRSLAGRFSVIAFVATYDVASQAQARFLTGLSRRHVPRINAAALVLEPAENRPMVEAFVKALKLPYPVALADAATIAGKGPFAGLHHVPSVVILDPVGREAWRHVGLAEEEEIAAALRSVESAGK